MLPESKAFARMTAGGALWAVGFFTGGDTPLSSCPFLSGIREMQYRILVGRQGVGKAAFMFPGCSHAQA